MEERELQADSSELENVNEDLQTDLEKSDTPLGADETEPSSDGSDGAVDYATLAREDLMALKAEFPELLGIADICELNNPLRYAALRDLGLSPAEAYLATAKRAPRRDNRAHLSAIKTVSYAPQSTMTDSEMSAAKELFSDMSDAEIRKLYKRVTK